MAQQALYRSRPCSGDGWPTSAIRQIGDGRPARDSGTLGRRCTTVGIALHFEQLGGQAGTGRLRHSRTISKTTPTSSKVSISNPNPGDCQIRQA